VPLLATDLEGILDKTVMDKRWLVPVHKPDQQDLLQALHLDLNLSQDMLITPLAMDQQLYPLMILLVLLATRWAMLTQIPPPPLPQRLASPAPRGTGSTT
jgi:hypothetical protein